MNWFGGRRVLSLESRRAEEMGTLIGQYGGVPVVAPSMREQKLDLTRALDAFERALAAGDIHALTCVTGMGTRMFLRELAARDPHHLDTLRGLPPVARGNKPMQALKEFGLTGVNVAKPHTWHEVHSHLLSTLEAGQHAVLLEYGEAMPAPMLRELGFAGLRARRSTAW